MRRWVDEPQWGDETATELHDALKAVHVQKEIEQIWVAIKMSPGDLYWEVPAGLLWPSMTKQAHAARKLEWLITTVRDRTPALADRLNAVLAAKADGESWYRSADPFRPRLLGPGDRRSLIDRGALSRGLKQVVHDGFPVFLIRGDSGTGKSHSLQLIQRVRPAGCQVVLLDVEKHLQEGSHRRVLPGPFAARLAQRLGMTAPIVADENTNAQATTRELAMTIVQHFQRLEKVPRWIFIDGLDRPGVHGEVHELVAHLADEADTGQLGQTQLIVTGHSGDFAPDVDQVLVKEEIETITKDHIKAFFSDVVADLDRPPLPDATIDEMAKEVLAGAQLTDLRKLGEHAARVARERFAAS